MRKDWETKELGEVCDLLNGYAFKSKWYVDHSNTMSIRMSNIRPDGNFDPDHNSRFLPDNLSEEYKRYLLSEGDLVIAMTDMASAPKILGLPTIVKDLKGRNFLLNQRVGKLHKFSDQIYVPFLRYYLSSPRIKEYYKSKGAGGLQINIGKKDVLSAKIPIPPLPEQKRIVAILDEAFEAIDQAKANIERNIENAEELFQSYLASIFSEIAGERKNLNEVCEIIGGGTPSKKKEEYYGGDIPWATVRDMNYEELETTDHNITKLGLENSSSNVIPEGNVVIATRVGLGKICLLKQDTAINQDLKGILPKKDSLKPEYLFVWFKSIADQIVEAGTGATVQGVKLPFVRSLKIPLISIADQNRIIENYNESRNSLTLLIESYEKKIEAIEELKKSILQKAFSGELTANEHVAA